MSKANGIHAHRLDGCRPTPLAHYLKALGILRLVAEQADQEVRGWWQDDVFHLATVLDRTQLEAFFLEDYQPTPILSPWLKGSGFYQSDDVGLSPMENSSAARFRAYRDGIAQCRELLGKIEHADAVDRAIKARTKRNRSFQTKEQREYLKKSFLLQRMLSDAADEQERLKNKLETEGSLNAKDKKTLQNLEDVVPFSEFIVSDPGVDAGTGEDRLPSVAEVNKLKKRFGYDRFLKTAAAEFKTQKANLILDCKTSWRGSIAQWMSAAVVIADDETPKWPALLGTGGNDGRFDFTNNLMQRFQSLFDFDKGTPTEVASALIGPALFGENCNQSLPDPSGQFFPSATGGDNCGTGFDGNVKLNTWDFVLMLEGSILFRAGTSRRLNAESLPQAAAPFAVRSSGIGYGSADDSDEGARGEQWMPLWSNPSKLTEIESVFGQSRLQIGRDTAQRGTEMARVLTRLGATRGIHKFQRFGYIERNGLSNFAVPLGQFVVRAKANQQLLDDVAPWIDRLRRVADGKNAPSSISRVYRSCEEAVIGCTQTPNAESFLELLTILAAAEDQLIRSPKYTAEAFAIPLPKLGKPWISLILPMARQAENHELRLALSLAAQLLPQQKKQKSRLPIRNSWLPLDETNQRRFASGESGLAIGPEQCACGQPLEAALIKIFSRALLVVSANRQENPVGLKLIRDALGAKPEDIEAFLNRQVSDVRLLATARALMALDFWNVDELSAEDSRQKNASAPSGSLTAYGVLKLAHGNASRKDGVLRLPSKGESTRCEAAIRLNPEIFRRLLSGDLSAAVRLAVRTLSNANLRPKVSIVLGSESYSRRLAASLAFGISNNDMKQLAWRLTDPDIAATDDEFELEENLLP